VFLFDDDDKLISEVANVASNSDSIIVVFDAGIIPPGSYRLQVDNPEGKPEVNRQILISWPILTTEERWL